MQATAEDDTTRWLRRVLDAGLPLPASEALTDFPDEVPSWEDLELR